MDLHMVAHSDKAIFMYQSDRFIYFVQGHARIAFEKAFSDSKRQGEAYYTHLAIEIIDKKDSHIVKHRWATGFKA